MRVTVSERPRPSDREAMPAWIGRMADTITRVIVDEVFPQSRGDVTFHARLARYTRLNIARIAATGNRTPAVDRPPYEGPRDFGRWLAEFGFPRDTLPDAYCTGIRQLLDEWARRSWQGLTADGTSPSPDTVRRMTSAAMDLGMRGMKRAVEAYEETTRTLRDNGELDRRRVVRAVLDGESPGGGPEAETDHFYELSRTHVCVLIDAPDHRAADGILRKAQETTGAQARLVVALSTPRWVGWLGRSERFTDDQLDDLRRTLRRARVRTAIGRPHAGVEGFRRSFAEATRAEELRPVLATGDACLSYHGLALESVLLRDVPEARAFAKDELGLLSEDTPRAERIRETLSLWLASGSRIVAASGLGVHENTVRQRLKAAADTLGPDYLDRRTELMVALRVCEGLGSVDG